MASFTSTPGGKQKGLLMLYNPLDQPVRKMLTFPLYYTGLTRSAKVSERGRRSQGL